VTDVHEWRSHNGRLPNGQEVAKIVGVRKKTAFEDRMAEVVADLQSLFAGQPPTELNAKMFRALSERWGFASSSKTHKISTVARKHRIDQSSLVLAAMALVRRLVVAREGHAERSGKMGSSLDCCLTAHAPGGTDVEGERRWWMRSP
jgi:hypothetical protein